MKTQRIAVAAPQAGNWDGKVAGLPRNASANQDNWTEEVPTQFDGSSVPEDWQTATAGLDIHRRATEPRHTTEEFEREKQACILKHGEQQRLTRTSFVAGGFCIGPQVVAKLAALLFALAILFWLGLKAAEAANRLLAAVGGG